MGRAIVSVLREKTTPHVNSIQNQRLQTTQRPWHQDTTHMRPDLQ